MGVGIEKGGGGGEREGGSGLNNREGRDNTRPLLSIGIL